MSEQNAVAWEYIGTDKPAGARWNYCGQAIFNHLQNDGRYYTRALVPETLLTASQARYERLRGMVEGLAHRMEQPFGAPFWAAEICALLADGGEANDNEVEG